MGSRFPSEVGAAVGRGTGDRARLDRLLGPECGTAVWRRAMGCRRRRRPRLEAHVAVMAATARAGNRGDARRDVRNDGQRRRGRRDDHADERGAGRPAGELRDAVRHVQVVHVDEHRGDYGERPTWSRVAASASMACDRIDPSRSEAAAKELLGLGLASFTTTDRYAANHWLDVLRQQLCWCHAIRQFVSLSERDGALAGSGTSRCSRPSSDRRSPRVSPERTRADLARRSAATVARHDRDAAAARGPWPSSEDPPVLRRHVGRARRALDLLRSAGDRSHEQRRRARSASRRAAQKDPARHPSQNGIRWIERICTARETCCLQGRPFSATSKTPRPQRITASRSCR